MRISDWSSDVCSSDLDLGGLDLGDRQVEHAVHDRLGRQLGEDRGVEPRLRRLDRDHVDRGCFEFGEKIIGLGFRPRRPGAVMRSEEHTSELQSLMRISYAVFCLKKKQN